MTDLSIMPTTGPRCGVFRFVVLALTLAGFVAMHGLASTGGGEAHCGSPAAFLLAGDAQPAIGQPVAHHEEALVDEQGMRADEPAQSNSDELMLGCLLALLGTLVAIGLRLVGGSPSGADAGPARQALAWLRSARAPPDPLFLSLCVFRL